MLYFQVATYPVLPDTGAGGHEAARGVPLDVSHAVVVGGCEELEVGSKVLVFLVIVTLEVKVIKVQVVRLLAENGSNNDETTSG